MVRRSQRSRTGRRSLSQNSIGDYDVGYGKPPVNSRFQPGQSGNPRGRPKAEQVDDQFLAAIDRGARKKYAVTIDGIQLRRAAYELISERVIRDALQGKPQAILLFLNLLQRFGQGGHRPRITGIQLEEVPTKLLHPSMSGDEVEDMFQRLGGSVPEADLKTLRKYLVPSDAFDPLED